MRWITVWLGALKGAVVVARTRGHGLSHAPDKCLWRLWIPVAAVALRFSTLSEVVPKLPDQWPEAL